jgi:hypothetical protein
MRIGSHGRRVASGGSASAAGLASVTSAISVRPHNPTSDAVCARAGTAASAWPKLFQGNPVRTKLRSHSAKVRPTANARMRTGPVVQSWRASNVPNPVNTASPAGIPITASGNSQAKRSASTSKAMPIQ